MPIPRGMRDMIPGPMDRDSARQLMSAAMSEAHQTPFADEVIAEQIVRLGRMAIRPVIQQALQSKQPINELVDAVLALWKDG